MWTTFELYVCRKERNKKDGVEREKENLLLEMDAGKKRGKERKRREGKEGKLKGKERKEHKERTAKESWDKKKGIE